MGIVASCGSSIYQVVVDSFRSRTGFKNLAARVSQEEHWRSQWHPQSTGGASGTPTVKFPCHSAERKSPAEPGAVGAVLAWVCDVSADFLAKVAAAAGAPRIGGSFAGNRGAVTVPAAIGCMLAPANHLIRVSSGPESSKFND